MEWNGGMDWTGMEWLDKRCQPLTLKLGRSRPLEWSEKEV